MAALLYSKLASTGKSCYSSVQGMVNITYCKSHLLSNGCTIKYSKKNVKIYTKTNIKINIKMLLHVSIQNDHHQGVRRLCFAKIINIKIVNWNVLLNNSSALWLHSYTLHEQDWITMYSSLRSLRHSVMPHSELYTSQTGLENVAA